MRALLVHDHGGPPLRYLLPPWQARARTAVYVPRPGQLSTTDRALLAELDVPVHLDGEDWDRRDHREGARRIAAVAAGHQADAITTASELFSVSTAYAARALGLRGAGPAASERARDKLLMREALAAAGFSVPPHRAVKSAGDIARALTELGGPLLLKPRQGMSAAGIQWIDQPADAAARLDEALVSLGDFRDLADREQDFLVEKLLVGDMAGWYDCAGLSDQVCVEGIVAEGRYAPAAITDVAPKVPPFTQSAHISPTSLSEDRQTRVLHTARRAVEALGLSTCATHVELKLMPDGSCAVIEIAARFPGRTVVPQTDYAYGTDLIGALADALLHGDVTELARPAVDVPRRAAATVHLYPSEYLRRCDTPEPFPFGGIEPVGRLLDPAIRVAGYRQRTGGWPVGRYAHEQSHWLAQIYLEGNSLPGMRSSVIRLRRQFLVKQDELQK